MFPAENHLYIRVYIISYVTKTIHLRLRIYLSILIVVILVGMFGMMTFENRTPLDAFYFVVVTISTVGFGDIHPVTAAGKLLTIGIILVGVGCFVGLAASSLDLMIENRERSVRLRNLNLLVGVFFSEVGNGLLRRFSEKDPKFDQVRSALVVSDRWTEEDFSRASGNLQHHRNMLDSRTLDLPGLDRFLREHKSSCSRSSRTRRLSKTKASPLSSRQFFTSLKSWRHAISSLTSRHRISPIFQEILTGSTAC